MPMGRTSGADRAFGTLWVWQVRKRLGWEGWPPANRRKHRKWGGAAPDTTRQANYWEYIFPCASRMEATDVSAPVRPRQEMGRVELFSGMVPPRASTST